MIIYCFDLKTKDLASYNTLKRRFYYHLNKLGKHNYLWNTKSVIAIDNKDEANFDLFFSKFKDYLVLYKSYVRAIEKVY